MAYFTVPKHIFTGINALDEAMPYIDTCGERALIVTGKHVGKSPMYEKLVKLMEKKKIEYIVFDGITGEPTVRMIDEGLRTYREERCDFIIGLGGGSPIDSAKAIAAMVVNSGKITDYMGKEITGDVPPVVAIPTTAGTGSEATRFTIIADQEKNIKMLLKGDCLVPQIAVIDPDFTMDMPKSVSAATGLDAFTHAVEAYTSKKAIPMTDTLAVSAIKRILEYLPKAYRNGYDGKAREEMSIAALEAGICINNSSVTIVHGMSRPIGTLFHVPHGLSNAMLLKACISFAMEGAYERFAKLAKAVGVARAEDEDIEAANKFLEAIDRLCVICEVPTLAEYGVKKEAFTRTIEKMAEDAITSGSPGNTRKAVTREDCIRIYKTIYAD